MSQQSVVNRSKPLKKHDPKAAVKIPAPETIRPSADPTSIEAMVAKAKIEQQNNAAYRALLEANERLVQQVFDLAKLYHNDFPADHPVVSESVPVTATEVAETTEPVKHISDVAQVAIGQRLSGTRRQWSSPDYAKAKDDMLQAVMRNRNVLGGNMTISQCATYLGTSKTTVVRYTNVAKRLRAQHSAN